MFCRFKALYFKFIAPRSVVYRVVCERLEVIDRITDAIECFRQMVEQANVHDEQMEWALGEWFSCRMG